MNGVTEGARRLAVTSKEYGNTGSGDFEPRAAGMTFAYLVSQHFPPLFVPVAHAAVPAALVWRCTDCIPSAASFTTRKGGPLAWYIKICSCPSSCRARCRSYPRFRGIFLFPATHSTWGFIAVWLSTVHLFVINVARRVICSSCFPYAGVGFHTFLSNTGGLAFCRAITHLMAEKLCGVHACFHLSRWRVSLALGWGLCSLNPALPHHIMIARAGQFSPFRSHCPIHATTCVAILCHPQSHPLSARVSLRWVSDLLWKSCHVLPSVFRTPMMRLSHRYSVLRGAVHQLRTSRITV